VTLDRRALPHTFGPWFARFTALTEVQRRAIPPILEGRDLLMCSATASGKTEAYAAPAVELVRRVGGGSARVVVVAPTRALGNDLRRRLEGPVGLVDVSLGRYTGEHKERVGGRLPAMMITTPEALDSLLARRPGALRGTRMVVVDEIHVLDNTPRGDQLRALLHRLEAAADSRPQRVAASATVDRPEELGRRYLRNPTVIVVPGIRKIFGRAFEGRSPVAVARHLEELAARRRKKVLVFCRSRNQVEILSAKLRGRTRFGDAVFAHHGSLAKGTRERTERLFHQAPAAVCFATLTLELGIDIGTVDYVLLTDPPGDVSSLMQRLGRGGRRGDTTRCGYLVANAGERHLYRTMFRLGKEGRLCGGGYGFRPSVAVQQALVLACAHSYVRAADLSGILPPELHEKLGVGACEAILERMVDQELLERAGGGRYVSSETCERRYQRGTLHSNIEDSATIDVVDRITGDIVGTIGAADTKRIAVGGRDRKIVKMTDERVLTDAEEGANPARFRPTGAPSVSFALGRAVVEALGVAGDAVGRIDVAGGTVLLHGLGTVGSLLFLERYAQSEGSEMIQESSPFAVAVAGGSPRLPALTDAALDTFLKSKLARLAGLTQAGPWRRGVPEKLLLDSVRRACGIDDVGAFLGRARLQPIEGVDAAVVTGLLGM